jgi:apolipoprotein N-acyltransferase
MTENSTQNTNRSTSKFIRTGADIVTVLLTGVLLSLSIEDGRFWPVTFIALVPMLLRMWTRSYWSIFWIGFASFYLYLFYSLQWIDVYGLHWRIILCFMTSILYGAVFLIGFWLMRKYNFHFFALVIPSVFVLLEFKQTIGFLPLPWPLLCHTQVKNLALIQIASLGGCWLVTFLLVHVNEALAHLIAGHFKPKILPVAVSPVLLILCAGLWGALSLAQTPSSSDLLATVVQGSEPTNVAWTEGFNQHELNEYRQVTMQELTKERDIEKINDTGGKRRLIVWPETSIPEAVTDSNSMAQIQALAAAFDATFVVGCLTYQPGEGVPLDLHHPNPILKNYDEYNSLVVFDPDRSVTPMYSKFHLVPFGEVIPLKQVVTKWFPAYPWGSNDIMPGTGIHVANTNAGTIGGVVCYESFFPQIARREVADGAQVLVLGSNTSWFQRTRASVQHADYDVFRAVENGIWFVRAATTGVSSIIDPQGHVMVETEMFKPMAATVPIGLRKGTTLYTRVGDWVPGLSGIFVLMLLLGAFVVRQRVD